MAITRCIFNPHQALTLIACFAEVTLLFQGGSTCKNPGSTWQEFTAAEAVYNKFTELTKKTGSKKIDRSYVGNFYSWQYDTAVDIRLRQSLRNVAPRLGGTVHFVFPNTPFHSFFNASQTALDATLYLPDFFRHHAIRIRTNWQKDDSTNYHFGNAFSFFRKIGPSCY